MLIRYLRHLNIEFLRELSCQKGMTAKSDWATKIGMEHPMKQFSKLGKIWVFPSMVGFPISHPKIIIIFSRKTHGLLGNPPFWGNIHMFPTKNDHFGVWNGETHHFKQTSIWIWFACVGPFRPTQRSRWFQGKVIQRLGQKDPSNETNVEASAGAQRPVPEAEIFGEKPKTAVAKGAMFFPWWTYFSW